MSAARARKTHNARRQAINALMDHLKQYEAHVSPQLFGEKLLAAGEILLSLRLYDAARLRFFDYYLRDVVPRIAGGSVGATNALPVDVLAKKISAEYGAAECRFQAALSIDPQLHNAGSVFRLCGVLDTVATSIEGALRFPDVYWQVFNGTVILYKMVRLLIRHGYAARVVSWLIWACRAMESSIPLLTVKYLPWRVTLYVAVVRAYVDSRDHGGALKSAEAFVSRALAQVDELKTLVEADDVPASAEDLHVLEASRLDLEAVFFQFKAGALGVATLPQIDGETGLLISSVEAEAHHPGGKHSSWLSSAKSSKSRKEDLKGEKRSSKKSSEKKEKDGRKAAKRDKGAGEKTSPEAAVVAVASEEAATTDVSVVIPLLEFSPSPSDEEVANINEANLAISFRNLPAARLLRETFGKGQSLRMLAAILETLTDSSLRVVEPDNQAADKLRTPPRPDLVAALLAEAVALAADEEATFHLPSDQLARLVTVAFQARQWPMFEALFGYVMTRLWDNASINASGGCTGIDDAFSEVILTELKFLWNLYELEFKKFFVSGEEGGEADDVEREGFGGDSDTSPEFRPSSATASVPTTVFGNESLAEAGLPAIPLPIPVSSIPGSRAASRLSEVDMGIVRVRSAFGESHSVGSSSAPAGVGGVADMIDLAIPGRVSISLQNFHSEDDSESRLVRRLCSLASAATNPSSPHRAATIARCSDLLVDVAMVLLRRVRPLLSDPDIFIVRSANAADRSSPGGSRGSSKPKGKPSVIQTSGGVQELLALTSYRSGIAELLQPVLTIFSATEYDNYAEVVSVAVKLGALYELTGKLGLALICLKQGLKAMLNYRALLAMDSRDPFDSLTTDIEFALSEKSEETSQLKTRVRYLRGDEAVPARQMARDVACLHVDLLLNIFRVELKISRATDAGPGGVNNSSVNGGTGPGRLGQKVTFSRNMKRSPTEIRLLQGVNKNPYEKVLLLISMAGFTESRAERTILLQEAAIMIREAHSTEKTLIEAAVAATGATPRSARMAGSATHDEDGEALALPPPRLVYRTHNSMVFTPSDISHLVMRGTADPEVEAYAFYGKPYGTGTNVSLTNFNYPGLGIARPSAHLSPGDVFAVQEGGSAVAARNENVDMIVQDLSPNESYIFAVAAMGQCSGVPEGIGRSSPQYVALYPLPLSLLWGYLASQAFNLQVRGVGGEAFGAVYDFFVNPGEIRPPAPSTTLPSAAPARTNPLHDNVLNRAIATATPSPQGIERLGQQNQAV